MTIKTPAMIEALPPAPNPADRSTFNGLAYPWSAALDPWTEQANQLATDTYANAGFAQRKAGEAGDAANTAGQAADSASFSAAAANTARSQAESARDASDSHAQSASSSATIADSAKTAAELARDKALQWATSTETVESGLKGARGYAEDAAQSAQDAADIAQGEFGLAIHTAQAKTAPADADELAISDSAESWGLKKLTWGSLKAAIWEAFKSLLSSEESKNTLGLGTAAARDVGTGEGQLVPAEQFFNSLQNAGALASASESYEYSSMGQVEKITTPDGDTLIAYSAGGMVETIRYPTGRIETFTYDNFGNVTSMTATGGEV